MPQYSLQQHDNGVWYIHWTEGRRSKRTSTGEKEEVAAQIFLGEWLKTDAADAGDAPPVYTVAELWGLYFERHVEKNLTREEIAVMGSLAKNLKIHFGHLTLPEVTRLDEKGLSPVDKYIELRKRGKIGRFPAAPATIRGELTRMLTAIRWCAAPMQNRERTIIKPSDVPVFLMPPDSQPRDRWLRAEQVAAFMDEAAKTRVAGVLQPIEVFLWIALQTTARMTAIFELTWDRVDFEVGKIDFRKPGRPVTKKRRAVVPISSALKAVLLLAYEQRTGDHVVPKFSPWTRINTMAKRAGITNIRVSPHVLRHTGATLMLRRGVPIWIVAGILGDTVATVERVYGHHVPDGLVTGVEEIYNPVVLSKLADKPGGDDGVFD